MDPKGKGIVVLLVAAFVLLVLVGIPAVNWFGWHGSLVAVYFIFVLVLWVVWSRKALLVVVCIGAVLFYLWRPFSGFGSPTQASASCPPQPAASSALQGPYTSIDQLMRCDAVGPYALRLTGTGTTEFGFVILRDRRRPEYFATLPQQSSQPPNPGCSKRPTVQPGDFIASSNNAINGAHVDKNNYVWAATVHTHPACPMASNNFTATDFNQAIVLKNAPSTSDPAVALEEIVMINANDRKVRTFAPRPGDQIFTPFGIEATDQFLPYLDLGWDRDALRVQIIATYPP